MAESGYNNGVAAPLEQYLSSISDTKPNGSDEARTPRLVGAMYEGTFCKRGADELFQFAARILQEAEGFTVHR